MQTKFYPSTDKLVAHAEALFLRSNRDPREKFGDKLKALYSTKHASGQPLTAANRAWERLNMYKPYLTQQVRSRVGIYAGVGRQYGNTEMFSKPRLDTLRDRSMTFVSVSCGALKDKNKLDAFAAGDSSPLPDEYSYQYLETIILAVVNDELKVLETEAAIDDDDAELLVPGLGADSNTAPTDTAQELTLLPGRPASEPNSVGVRKPSNVLKPDAGQQPLPQTRIREYLRDEEYTIAELAKELRVSRQAMSSAVNGGNRHGKNLLAKLANKMHIELELLMS